MDIPAAEWQTIVVTLRLALVSTVVLLLLGTPLAWWLARTQSLAKDFINALVTLPLVLPPTVLGFYLLVLMGPEGPVGWLTQSLGIGVLVFSFPGLVMGSVVYSLPFVVQPLQNAFEAMGTRPMEVAATLRASPWDRFFTVAVPLARPGFVTAAILGFTHTVGEFGVVLMIGGSIPGATRVLSIAVYENVEALDYSRAHSLAALMVVFSLVVLMGLYAVNRRLRRAGT